MISCDLPGWTGIALTVAYALLEFWLGRTPLVKAGSVLEAIINGLAHIVLVLAVGFLSGFLWLFYKSEKKDEH